MNRKRNHYFEDIKLFAEWYRIKNKIPVAVESMLEEPFLSRLKVLMKKENEDRFSRRSNTSKKGIKKIIEGGKHVSTQLNASAIERYQSVLPLLPEVFSHKELDQVLISLDIEPHNSVQYRNYWIECGFVKCVYEPEFPNNIDITIWQKVDQDGKCNKTKLEAYRKDNKLISKAEIKRRTICEKIIPELPEVFTYADCVHVLAKHGRGPSYIKDIVRMYPELFEKVDSIPANKPASGRGGNNKRVVYRKVNS